MTKLFLQKVTARVFATTAPKSGKNVTVFSSTERLSSKLHRKLAETCEWESVMVRSGKVPAQFRFYMPTGEELDFRVHAAMGAVRALDENRRRVVLETRDGTLETCVVKGEENVGLQINSAYERKAIEDMDALRGLLEQIQVKEEDVILSTPDLPSGVNITMVRPKTLLCMASVGALHAAKAPTNPQAFKEACAALSTTGLYLYAPSKDGAYECRQFPWASGYAEDPATGVAAAGLAVALHQSGERKLSYDIHQGTAMGRPSIVSIQDIMFQNEAKVQLTCWGRVHVDSRETIEVENVVGRPRILKVYKKQDGPSKALHHVR